MHAHISTICTYFLHVVGSLNGDLYSSQESLVQLGLLNKQSNSKKRWVFLCSTCKLKNFHNLKNQEDMFLNLLQKHNDVYNIYQYIFYYNLYYMYVYAC